MKQSILALILLDAVVAGVFGPALHAQTGTFRVIKYMAGIIRRLLELQKRPLKSCLAGQG